ncbi:hypothetical protein [Pedobacter soli]|uniref:Uncharacterized protein n=1 Tax=Pedobacter soli TaxID=390242 RepID=A0A1G6YGU0_9SPHI|nr:hypothetical protein [Pedobacter soli]SDD89588.1 hypothetical protein SAMN04488024_10914 [Pedobacter soli]
MAQLICALIVLDDVVVPPEIVHFRENRAFIIPLDPDKYDVDWTSLSVFIAHVFSCNDLATALSTSSAVQDKYDDDDDELFTYDFSALASLIKEINPDRFILTYYEDFADITVHQLYLTVIDGKVVREATCFYDGEFELNPEFDDYQAHRALINQGTMISWLNQEKYRSYDNAKKAFEKG